jgi:hypothetical protein
MDSSETPRLIGPTILEVNQSARSGEGRRFTLLPTEGRLISRTFPDRQAAILGGLVFGAPTRDFFITPPGFFDGGAGAISDALIQEHWDNYRNTVQAIMAGNRPVACSPTNRPPSFSQGRTDSRLFSGGPPPAYSGGSVNGPTNVTITGYR